ncbi:MAG: acyltransferase [Ignavibacteria bacterium]|nr:acyltransferase [Ignavibacteria bacterium]
MISDSKITYMPQLDSLRAFSIFLVLLGHWVQEDVWFKKIPVGTIGVTIFFVLSGFLISGILMKNRDSADQENKGIFYFLKHFYIRRTLRIFPVYYFTLAVLYVLNTENIRAVIGWFVLYISNYYLYFKMDWAGSLSHFWTLAVEEQFYIFWPLVIFFTPKKHLLKVIYVLILTGVLFRGFNFLINDRTEYHTMFSYMLTLSCIDAFSLGALLAYARNYIDKNIDLNKGVYLYVLYGVFLLMIILMFFEINVIDVAMSKFCISVIALFMVSKLSLGAGGIWKLILENKFIIYIGKISYGMYIFHTFIPAIYTALKIPPAKSLIVMFVIYFLMLLIISSVSWYLLEKPINSLKKKFSYG